MAKQYQLLKEINDGTQRWTTKVCIHEMRHPQSTKNSKSTYQHLILIDEEVLFNL